MTLFRRALLGRELAVVTSALNGITQCIIIFTSSSDPQLYVAYSPYPYFTLGIFLVQVLIESAWLMGLFADDQAHYHPILPQIHSEGSFQGYVKIEEEAGPDPSQMVYLPAYIFGNLCFGFWGMAWLNQEYVLGQLIMELNLAFQIFAVVFSLHASRSDSTLQRHGLTILLAKTRVANSLLILFTTWGAVDNQPPPAITHQFGAGIASLLLSWAMGPDPTVGICLLYNFMALTLGQHHNNEWPHAFAWISVAVGLFTFCDWASSKGLNAWLVADDIGSQDEEKNDCTDYTSDSGSSIDNQ